MSGGGMQAQQGVGTAASGGKGGQMGGPNLNGMSQAGTGPDQPMVMPTVSAGGKGGEDNSKYLPDESGYQRLPVPQDAPEQTQPNAFETGLNAMNSGMDWMGNAMNYQAPKLGGDYGVAGIDGANYLDQLAGAGAAQAKATMMSAPDKGLYDYDAALAQGQSYNAAQLADKNINDYMNPYTQNVIDNTMADLGRARDDAMNASGVAATRGGAFGGDRHAIMESQNNADYMRQAANTSAQLRNQGYQSAQAAAMGDVNSLNQQRATNAGMAQQANMANQAAQNARSQFVGSTANQNAMTTAMQNQNAQNQMAALNAQLGTSANMQNASAKNAMLGQLMGYDNANQQFNAGMDFSRDQFNAGQDQQSFMNQMAAAQGVYGMGNDRWNMGQDQVDKMAGVGNSIDQINQGYINQAMQAFLNQQNAPQEQYQQMLAAMSGMPNFGGTQSYNPGFFDYASLGAGLGGAYLSGSRGGK